MTLGHIDRRLHERLPAKEALTSLRVRRSTTIKSDWRAVLSEFPAAVPISIIQINIGAEINPGGFSIGAIMGKWFGAGIA